MRRIPRGSAVGFAPPFVKKHSKTAALIKAFFPLRMIGNSPRLTHCLMAYSVTAVPLYNSASCFIVKIRGVVVLFMAFPFCVFYYTVARGALKVGKKMVRQMH